MRGDGCVFVKDGDEFDGHVAFGHIRGHADEDTFGRDGLVATRHVKLTGAEGFESIFECGEKFLRVEEFFYFFTGEDEHMKDLLEQLNREVRKERKDLKSFS